MPELGIAVSWLPQDPLLLLAFQIGLGVIACSMLMLVAVIVLRLRLVYRQRRERRYTAMWQPLLAECVYQVPAELPRLPRAMRYHFLKLWNYHHESLVGSARDNLEKMAAILNLDDIARELLASGNRRERLIAILTLGHLGDRTQWHKLRALVADPSPILSQAAASALLAIDAAATLAWLVTVMAAREDWPLSRVVSMLREAGPNRTTLPLISAVQAAARIEGGSQQVVRLLRMMETAHTERVAPVVGQIVRESDNPEVIAAGLRLMQDPRDLDAVRGYAKHEAWFVRVSAVRTLGKIGEKRDCSMLIELLGDRNWWVRYHAARSLLELPFSAVEDLEKIRDSHPDRYAADMLSQVIAEARAS